MMMLQGLGGPYLLQLLMMRIQSQQGLASASAALATARNSQLQFPVPGHHQMCLPRVPSVKTRSCMVWAAIHVFKMYCKTFSYNKGFLPTAAATESDMHLQQQQDLAS
jgi:hypothetical protein